VKQIVFYSLLLFGLTVSAQIKGVGKGISDGDMVIESKTQKKKDSLKKEIPKLPATEYKIFNLTNDTISLDTTLTIRDAYRFNQLFKDDFNFLSFQNIGQPLTQLDFDISTEHLLPGFVADTKLTDYWQHSKMPFFKIPTPYSDLSYLNGISQGQILNALFAINITPQLNVAAGYRGLSSLGLYRHSISSSGRFFGSLNYNDKNNVYSLKLYYYTYEKTNEENGGLKDAVQFEQAGEVYSDRGRIDVNLTDAENQLKHRRLFIGNSYGILKNKFFVINNTTYRDNMYQFKQNSIDTIIIGPSSQSNTAVNDSIKLRQFDNFSGLKFKVRNIQLESGLRFIYQFYGFDSIKNLNGTEYPKFLEYKDASLDSKLAVTIGKLDLKGRLDIGFTPNIAGYYLQADATYQLPKDFMLQAQLKSISKRPDFKYILYQSAYDKFNWYHPDLKNELIQKLQGHITHKKYGKLTVNQIIVNNYTYYGQDSLPRQSAAGVKYSTIKYQNDFYYKRWGLATDIQLQKVLDGQSILSLPTYVLRGSLFYSRYFFKHNLFVQTGFTGKYFEAFYARAYNPVLGDFVVQNYQKIGGYPIVDYFINFKIKRFRFYFKLEHLNGLLEQQEPTYYAAPLQAYRDFTIRFGLRWIFFN